MKALIIHPVPKRFLEEQMIIIDIDETVLVDDQQCIISVICSYQERSSAFTQFNRRYDTYYFFSVVHQTSQ